MLQAVVMFLLQEDSCVDGIICINN